MSDPYGARGDAARDEWLNQPYASERKVLEQMKIGATMRQSMQVEVSADVMRNELEHRMSAFVLADHIADDIYIAHTTSGWPDSTWQMFKSRHEASWWLAWLVRRRPVRQHIETQRVEVEVKRYLSYPEANLALPEFGRPVIIERASQVDWRSS